MNTPDIRWQQRLNNFDKACNQLEAAITLANQRELSELEQQGLIQAFEFVFELAWNVMKDYFRFQGNPDITGSRDAIRQAFKQELISDGEGWMEMIKSRNRTAHTYNQAIADDIAHKIITHYGELFVSFRTKMKQRARQQDD